MADGVSVIIPCYNNEACIEAAIASALGQTYPHTDVIVIDDGSSDRSLAAIQAFGSAIRWVSQPNQGAPTARNRGIEMARGPFIKFLDADDRLFPDSLERQVAIAQQRHLTTNAIVYGDAQWVDHTGAPLPGTALKPRQPHEDPVAHILRHSPLTSCPLHRREYLQAIGGFDPALTRGQEHDLHLRLVLSGVEFVHHPGAVYQYRNLRQPDRISDQTYSATGAMRPYDTLQHHCRLIAASRGTPLPPEVSQALAQQFWACGRAILREGHHLAAQQYFDAARSLHRQRCVVGRFPYPRLVQWFGADRAEQVMQILRRTGQVLASPFRLSNPFLLR